jgi:aspartate aminotransferase-like enzyme
MSDPLLMIPGPTPVPPRVLQAMTRPMINHRGKEYAALFREVNEGLKAVFQTRNDVLTFPSAGTGALEAAIVNLLSPGDKVLSVSVGAFGDRFAQIAEAFGAHVVKLEREWGDGAEASAVAEKLASPECQGVKAVLLTQNETSTGVTNPVKDIAEEIRKLGNGEIEERPLLLVDAISGLGAIDLPMDEWGVDVVITGAQKALMCPPGLGFVALNERAWKATETATMPRFYWDFREARRYAERDQNPYTPAVSLLFALRESLAMIQEEGLPQVWQRHARLGDLTREGVKELGLALLVKDPRFYSNTVTAVCAPDGVPASHIISALRDQHNIVVAGGQGKLRDKIFRIGHVGYVHEDDVRQTLAALRAVLEVTHRAS